MSHSSKSSASLFKGDRTDRKIISNPIDDWNRKYLITNADQHKFKKMSRPNLLENREVKSVQQEVSQAKLSGAVITSKHAAVEKPLTEMISTKRPSSSAVAETSEKRQKHDKFQRSQNERKMTSRSHERSHYESKT